LDGQNNHNWKAGTPVLKWLLEDCGRFTVDVSTSPPQAKRPRLPKKATKDQRAEADRKFRELKAASAGQWDAWRPSFKDYGVVVLNYTGQDWPEPVREAFLEYVSGGGGIVVIHAANNAFGRWKEFNLIIGIGGWGGRNEKSGPYVRWRDGKTVIEQKPGKSGGHGPKHEFVVETRDFDHPVTKGMPARWMHAKDELYQTLRGPAENLTLLATALAAKDKKGTGENEPIFFTIRYGEGRVFHNVLGHDPTSMSGVGFQVMTQRGAEWAATGKVTLAAPSAAELPADRAAVRPMPK
jgi:type 1 glutamine amidotransferase